VRTDRIDTGGGGDALVRPPGPAGRPAGIALDGVTKRFGRTLAVDGVSLAIAAGEFFVVLGPSGCGKSTLLRLIAGLETADAGEIRLGGDVVARAGRHVPPEARSVAVVFQSYALWPHMSVRKNVAFPVESAGVPRAQALHVVEDALRAVALEDLAARRPAALSGGQQQRVALARCLASRAQTVLMDEPLANLDVHLRAAMEDELARVDAASGATTLYITHDQREAMALATRVAVMQEGRILQVDAPQTLYERPKSETVAAFIGRSTICDGIVERVDRGEAAVRVGPQAFIARCAPGTEPGPARIMIRPHEVRLGAQEGIDAVAERSAYRGGAFELVLRADRLPPVAAIAPDRANGPVRLALTGGWVIPVGG